MRQKTVCNLPHEKSILIHASARDATIIIDINLYVYGCFNPRIREGCDKANGDVKKEGIVLIHASARDATAKSYKIGNNFTVLFRKFVQKFDIVTFYISIF